MPAQKKVGLFVSCLVDMFRPSIASSAMQLLQKCGFQVSVSKSLNCCGQIAFNNGDRETAYKIARDMIYEFYDCDYIVTPSASCAAMVLNNYEEFFPPTDSPDDLYANNMFHFNKDEDLHHRNGFFHTRFYELTDFLYHVVNFQPDNLSPYLNDKKISYHDSCSSLRHTKTFIAARGLLARAGVAATDLPDAESCCGFGGNFTTDFPTISAAITDKKCDNILSTKPDILLSADLGCLLHLVGRLSRRGQMVEAFHLIEFLNIENHQQPLLPIGQEVKKDGGPKKSPRPSAKL